MNIRKNYLFLNHSISLILPEEVELCNLKQHLPSIIMSDVLTDNLIKVEFIESKREIIQYDMNSLKIYDKWSSDWLIDLPHLIYSYVKYVCFHKQIYFVHSIVINGNLLIGNTGSGKTTLALSALEKDLNVSSFDKTCLCFKDNKLTYLTGTDVVSIRKQNKEENYYSNKILNNLIEKSKLKFLNENNERLLYKANVTSIKSIENEKFINGLYILLLQKDKMKKEIFEGLSVVHQLYPYFLDSTKNDCIVKGGKMVFSPIYDEFFKIKLFNSLKEMNLKNLIFISGTDNDILNDLLK